MFKRTKPSNEMKLSDFISQTIKEIIDGISNIQPYAKEKGAAINPRHVNWSDSKDGYFVNTKASSDDDEAPILTPIEFEILLSIGDSSAVEGGAGIFATAINLGAKGETKRQSESANRVKFQILAKLPQQK